MDKKKALCLASMASNLDNFNRNNVKILKELGYDITLAANFHTSEDTNSQEKIFEFVKEMKTAGIHIAHIVFSRRIGNVRSQIRSYKQVKEILKQRYDLIHCHSPIGGVITRLAAKKYRSSGTKVIYTAHGFHFYDGAPLKNWIFYYQAEKFLSRYTDVLITINKEDYKRAKEKFKAKKTVYIPGVGVDTDKFAPRASSRERIRTELGLKNTDIMLLSVGELNENKNHGTVIRAIKGMHITYVIVGKGAKKDELKTIAEQCGVDLRLMGYRSDVADIYNAADVYVLPSIREGLNVSLMEAMASGVAVACSRIRGNTDLIDDDGCLFDSSNLEEIRAAINTAIEDRGELGKRNLKKIQNFSISTVENIVSKIYREVLDNSDN